MDREPLSAVLPMLGRVLDGRFRILSEIAQGGMGIAYRAVDEMTTTMVVVKVPKPTLLEDPLFSERFAREIRAMATLVHPHVVPILGYGVEAAVPYLVMRHLPGGSLASRIPLGKGGLPTGAALPTLHSWLRPIAAVLDDAHARGIVHRDVKPANIFFDATGTAYLGDFGIAKLLEETGAADAQQTLTGTNAAIGSHHYIAPERLGPRAPIDGLADQYSLGVTVYELLAARRPFVGETAHIVVEQATMPPPPLSQIRPDLSSEVCDAVHKSLAKKPGDRFATCSEFAQAVLAGVPEPVRDSGVARLLCPGCQKLLRIPFMAAGKQGNCPHCREKLTIADDMSGLWPPDATPPRSAGDSEDSPAGFSADEPAPPAPLAQRPKRRWLWPTASLGMIAAVVAWMIANREERPAFEVNRAAATEEFRPDANQAADADHDPKPLAPSVGIPPETKDDTVAKDSGNGPSTLETDAGGGDPKAAPEPEPPPAQTAQSAIPADMPLIEAIGTADMPPPATEPQPVEPQESELAFFDKDVRWVLIGDPGNASDPQTGRGAVARDFVIAQYELTNSQYCRFLNGSATGRRAEHGTADCCEGGDENLPVCGILRLEQPDRSFRYQPKPHMADKPVTNLRWTDAARLANWLHNGATVDADTETGAYALSDGENEPDVKVAAAESARFWVPTIDEWYKAAHFMHAEGGGYSKYPTASNGPLKPIQDEDFSPTGDGLRRGVETKANFAKQARWTGSPLGAVTTVGTNGAASAYGVYDMAGNVAEFAFDGNNFVAVGGDHTSPLAELDRYAIRGSIAASTAHVGARRAGIRLARTAEFPLTVAYDPAERQSKVPTERSLGRLLRLFPPKASPRLNDTDIAFETLQKSVSSLLEPGIDADLRTLIQGIVEDLGSAAEVRERLKAQMKPLLSNGPASGSLFDALASGILAGLQNQEAVDAALKDLRPIQSKIDAIPKKATELRDVLKDRYGLYRL